MSVERAKKSSKQSGVADNQKWKRAKRAMEETPENDRGISRSHKSVKWFHCHSHFINIFFRTSGV